MPKFRRVVFNLHIKLHPNSPGVFFFDRNDNDDGNDDGLNGGHVVVNVKIQFYRTDYTLKSLFPSYVLRDISRMAQTTQNNKKVSERRPN